MFFGLKKKLDEGQAIPLTLTFAKAGPVSLEAKVERRASGMEEMHHHH